MMANTFPELKIPLFIKLSSIYLLGCAGYSLFGLLFGNDNIKLIYGLSPYRGPAISLLIVMIFLVKTWLTYGFLTGHYWSIRYGILDAVIGIMIYIVATSIPFIEYAPAFPNNRVIGLEILILIPYLYTLLYFNSAQKLVRK